MNTFRNLAKKLAIACLPTLMNRQYKEKKLVPGWKKMLTAEDIDNVCVFQELGCDSLMCDVYRSYHGSFLQTHRMIFCIA